MASMLPARCACPCACLIACDDAPCWAPLHSADQRACARAFRNRSGKAKAADNAAADKAAADKAAAEKKAADEAAAQRAAVERAAVERAAAEKFAAEKVAAAKTAAAKASADKAAAEKKATDEAAAQRAAVERAAVERAAAEKKATSMINEGAPWDFFMSHKQGESGPDVALITRDLEKAGKEVWLDKNMKDCSTAAMMEGVEHSKTFVLVLSDGYFGSQFCVKELRRAISLEKKIVLCHKQGVNVGAILQKKPPDPEFAHIGEKQSLELVTSDAVYREFAVKRLMDSASSRV